jgi:hypothetical protein
LVFETTRSRANEVTKVQHKKRGQPQEESKQEKWNDPNDGKKGWLYEDIRFLLFFCFMWGRKKKKYRTVGGKS